MNISLRHWLSATRPPTLAASISPVILGCALAFRDHLFRPLPAILCFLVALLAQIAANFANDYLDGKNGLDTPNRLGPTRAVASKRIAPNTMRLATLTVLTIACACGLLLIWMAGWQLLPVGIAIIVGVGGYSAMACRGWGDVCVLVFYGIVPGCCTYYVQAGGISRVVWLLSVAVGLMAVNILVVNNYRDYEEDKRVGKRTTIVRFGRRFGRLFYLANGLVAVALAFRAVGETTLAIKLLFAFFLALFFTTWNELRSEKGRMLNKTLTHTARNVLLFTLLLLCAL